jgi:hypothetical protein
VRDRDERCCVTNFLVRTESFARVRATHIFPLAYKDVVSPSTLSVSVISVHPTSPTSSLSSIGIPQWDSLGFAELIDDDYPATDQSPRGINSIQNGILLRMDVHHAFDGYEIGIDPDVSHSFQIFSQESSLIIHLVEQLPRYRLHAGWLPRR